MGETLTPNLGLIKPNKDTSTPLDVDRINLNSDVLDDAARVQTVAPGVIPPAANLWDGKLVREATTGKVWVAEKQTNGSYLRRWVAFPWAARANYNPAGLVGVSRAAWKELLTPTLLTTHCVNTGSTTIVSGGRIQVPITGTYIIRAFTFWHAYGIENTTGTRQLLVGFNGSVNSTFTNSGRVIVTCSAEHANDAIFEQTCFYAKATAGTDISCFAYQNSTSGGTGPLGIDETELEVILISPDPTAS